MEKTNKKTPFRDLVNTLKEIREKPLSEEEVEKINSIIENDNDDFENADSIKKIAKPSENTENFQ